METTDRDVSMHKHQGLSGSLPRSGATCLLVQFLDGFTQLVTNSCAIDGAADVGLAGSALVCNRSLRKSEGFQLAEHFLDGHPTSTNQVMYD